MAPATVQVPPPVLAVTVYPVMADPPVFAGSVQVTATCGLLPLGMPATAVAVPMVGAWATVAAVALEEGVEDGLVPAALVAVTVKVYAVPAVSPVVTEQEVVAEEHVAPPGLAVTV